MLSHYDTSERMLRWQSRIEAQRGIAMHRLNECAKCDHANRTLESKLAELCSRLVQRRMALGLTQARLAKMIDASQTLVSEIELGKRDFRITTLLKMCSALDVQLFQVPSCVAQSVELRIRQCESMAPRQQGSRDATNSK